MGRCSACRSSDVEACNAGEQAASLEGGTEHNACHDALIALRERLQKRLDLEDASLTERSVMLTCY